MPSKHQIGGAWIFGGLLLALFCALVVYVVLKDRQELWWLLSGTIRFLIAIAGGFLAALITGYLKIGGEQHGFQISAGGGLAVFILLLYLNPVRTPTVPPTPPTFEGENLGDFVDLLQQAYAEGKTTERISINTTNAERLRRFHLSVNKVSAKTWVEVAKRICNVNSCLVCQTRDKDGIEIDLRSEPIKCSANNHTYYVCADRSCP